MICGPFNNQLTFRIQHSTQSVHECNGIVTAERSEFVVVLIPFRFGRRLHSFNV